MEAQLRRTAWLLLSLVLLAASPVASQTDALASYTRMPGRNLKINDYTCAGTTSGPGYCQLGGSPADAAQKCNQDPNCHGFVFILGTGGNFYYLKGGSSAPLDVSKATQDPATDLYVKQGGSSAGTYTQYQATNYKPGDFDCPGTKTPGYCNFDGSPTDAKAKCNSVTGCEGFVFILGTSGNFYYLKSGPGDTLLDPSLKTYDPATDFYYRQPSAVSTPSPTVAPLASPIPAALSPSPTAPALVAATKAPLSPPAPTAAATVAANPAPLSPPPPSSPASIAGPVETNLASPEAPPLVAASPQPPSPTLPAVALLIPINGPPSPRTTPSPTEPAITPAIVPPVVAPVPAPVETYDLSSGDALYPNTAQLLKRCMH
ncbi:hypothetical protein WJX72_007085 [[Myrmecia] bisecta]|uniref:Uncharacterized protein n=1 Tax=[Myrmecia] bisecta TaxID=41462 RepID=A0AAW1Q812_9CHLO